MKKNICLFPVLLFCLFNTSYLFSQSDLIPYRKYDAKTEKSMWGFCDKNKKIIIHLKYDFVQPFSEGRALVNSGDKYGFIDEKGNEVIPIRYEADLPHYSDKNIGDDFKDGLARVKLNGKWGFIDKDGKEIIPAIYDEAGYFENGLAQVRKIREGALPSESCGLINREGKVVLPLIYANILDLKDGFMVAQDNLNMGLVDKEGKLLTEMKYKTINEFVEGFAKVSIWKTVGFINRDGKEVVLPKYVSATDFHNGFARVAYQIGEIKWLEGYVDSNGTEYWDK